jgi:hypothetical protein
MLALSLHPGNPTEPNSVHTYSQKSLKLADRRPPEIKQRINAQIKCEQFCPLALHEHVYTNDPAALFSDDLPIHRVYSNGSAITLPYLAIVCAFVLTCSGGIHR